MATSAPRTKPQGRSLRIHINQKHKTQCQSRQIPRGWNRWPTCRWPACLWEPQAIVEKMMKSRTRSISKFRIKQTTKRRRWLPTSMPIMSMVWSEAFQKRHLLPVVPRFRKRCASFGKWYGKTNHSWLWCCALNMKFTIRKSRLATGTNLTKLANPLSSALMTNLSCFSWPCWRRSRWMIEWCIVNLSSSLLEVKNSNRCRSDKSCRRSAKRARTSHLKRLRLVKMKRCSARTETTLLSIPEAW